MPKRVSLPGLLGQPSQHYRSRVAAGYPMTRQHLWSDLLESSWKVLEASERHLPGREVGTDTLRHSSTSSRSDNKFPIVYIHYRARNLWSICKLEHWPFRATTVAKISVSHMAFILELAILLGGTTRGRGGELPCFRKSSALKFRLPLLQRTLKFRSPSHLEVSTIKFRPPPRPII